MTIFSILAKTFLIKAIKALRTASLNADASLTNKSLKMFGYGRDKGLSEQKQELADKYWSKIEYLPDGENDEATKESLRQLLGDFAIELEAICAAKRYDTGNFGKGLERLDLLLNSIFQELKIAGCIDLAKDDSPYSIFAFYTGLYLSEKIVDAANLTFLEKVAQNPQVSSVKEIAFSKRDLLIEKLKSCKDELTRYKLDIENYDQACMKRVKEFIEAVMTKNEEIIKGGAWDIPISVSFFTSVTLDLSDLKTSSKGGLYQCMEKAKLEILEQEKKISQLQPKFE